MAYLCIFMTLSRLLICIFMLNKDFPNIAPGQPLKLSTLPFQIDILQCYLIQLQNWHHEFKDPYWRLYWMATTGFSVWHENKEYPIQPDQLMLIPAETPCKTSNNNPGLQFYIHFTAQSQLSLVNPGVYTLTLTEELKRLILNLQLTQEVQITTGWQNALMLRRLCIQCLETLPILTRNFEHFSERIGRAINLMESNISRPWSNSAVAYAIGMSTSAYIRLFSSETGIPPQKWIMDRRIKKASVMLSHGRDSIESIAEATGFFDRAHFSRVFRAARGLGPASYRKQSSLQT